MDEEFKIKIGDEDIIRCFYCGVRLVDVKVYSKHLKHCWAKKNDHERQALEEALSILLQRQVLLKVDVSAQGRGGFYALAGALSYLLHHYLAIKDEPPAKP